MPSKNSRICDFCHKRGHTEQKCWKKFPAVRNGPCVSSLRIQGNECSQPLQRLDDGNSISTEQEESSPLFMLPNELLFEIVSHLRTADKHGNVDLQSLKSFSLVSKRARGVTAESLPLTVSCCCSHRRPFRQIISSKGFLSQTKQLVLQPGLDDNIMNTGPSKFNQLMKHMPRLRELNIHLRVPLGGILGEGQLPLVKTLSVPINQAGYGSEATSIIRACPNVTLLRLNLSGPRRFQAPDRTGRLRVCLPETQRALEAAAALKSLRDLELSKFCAISFRTAGVSRNLVPAEFLGDGWLTNDLRCIERYFPSISSLAIFGESGGQPKRRHREQFPTPLGLIIECARMTNLSRLTIMSDFVNRASLPEKEKTQVWSGSHDSIGGYPTVHKAFKTLPNLQELSLVCRDEGRTWSPVCAGQEASGTHVKRGFKTRDFVNSRYNTFGDTGVSHDLRWF